MTTSTKANAKNTPAKNTAAQKAKKNVKAELPEVETNSQTLPEVNTILEDNKNVVLDTVDTVLEGELLPKNDTVLETPEGTEGTEGGEGTEGETPAQTEEQAKRVTLISALVAGNADQVATVLIRQGRTVAELEAFAATMLNAVSSFTVMKTQLEEQRQKDELAAQQERDAAEKENAEVRQLIEANKEKAIEAMAKTLQDSGVPMELALKVATETLAGASAARTSAQPKQKVQVMYNGTPLLVAVTGNNKEVVKAAIKESGLERAEFIKKYQVKDEEVA